ncbi:sll0787 family AIR synthase-like protein [Herbaspirillum sp. RV1423]|uniref:sll0787 family AIR synthase-like protein n=1 Tax=Herbaspirillum sp. RV1423 TaxID=1443993 RepID=UPI0004B77FFA|nr:sll0787 family AIR synthase-like protein [Herbaspirillum sp. RV1423]
MTCARPLPDLAAELAPSALEQLAETLRQSRGIAHKRDIGEVMQTVHPSLPTIVNGQTIAIGDDCAAIPDGDGYLLFAIEGFINEFVEKQPWFAGYCGVMVNVSDIYAMGGRPVAVVDALWSRGGNAAQPVLEGLMKGAEVYGVPLVGGHSNRRNDREQLSVAIVGRARRLLTSFDALPGDNLVAAVDLRGRFEEPYSYWNASTGAAAQRLRGDLELLPSIAEDGLSAAGKDISMAGIVGTALMLLECSGVGATIDLDAIPRPAGVDFARWLGAFPSYGFLLSVSDAALPEVLQRFAARDIACAAIGRIDDTRQVHLRNRTASVPFWDLNHESLIGCAPTKPRKTGA